MKTQKRLVQNKKLKEFINRIKTMVYTEGWNVRGRKLRTLIEYTNMSVYLKLINIVCYLYFDKSLKK